MKGKKILCPVLALLLLIGLVGCAAEWAVGNKSAVGDAAMTEMNSAEESGGLSGENLTAANQSADRKWIITVNMQAETEDLDELLREVNTRVEELKGYVESSGVYNGSTYSQSRRYRNASLTIRIPAGQVDAFTEGLSGISNITSSDRSMEDITLTYVSVESRRKALETEETRLLTLMEQAETMSDLLEIEARLTEVRYELESTTSQLRVYDNQVDYATIYLHISEVREYTVVEEQTLWQRIGRGFMDSLEGVGNFFVELFVFLISNLPCLAVVAVGAGGMFFLVRRILRKFREKKK